MTIPRGLWDQTAVKQGWFDETAKADGWFNPDALDTPISPYQTNQNKTGILLPNSSHWIYDPSNANGDRPTGGSSNLSFSGTLSHGSTITITDTLSRFGTRANVKPLYVAMGTQKAGLSLGRMTGDYFNAAAAASSAKTIGSITQAYRFDFKASSADAWGQDLFVTEDSTRPLIQYIERYYDFDIRQSQYQNASGGFNLKTNRIWATVGQNNDIYVGYQGSEAGSQRIYCEHASGTWPADYTGKECPGLQWLSERFVFTNSSAVDAADAGYDLWRNNVLQNTAGHIYTTRSTDKPAALNRVFLDQVSNDCGNGVSNVWGYYGYMCFDDEYKEVYLGDSPTRSSCTKFVKQPQTAWAAGSLSFSAVNSALPISGSYVHISTAQNTWLEALRLI